MISMKKCPVIGHFEKLFCQKIKMSGRGLGFTGGTVDKLESIPGYETAIDINSFVKNVEKNWMRRFVFVLNVEHRFRRKMCPEETRMRIFGYALSGEAV